MLALVLVASLAFFPVFLIPSGPSMWLAGMVFGYGLGFVIIMVGTTIGMILPYSIGLLFRDRIHVRNEQLWFMILYNLLFYFLYSATSYIVDVCHVFVCCFTCNLCFLMHFVAMVKKMASKGCYDSIGRRRKLAPSV